MPSSPRHPRRDTRQLNIDTSLASSHSHSLPRLSQRHLSPPTPPDSQPQALYDVSHLDAAHTRQHPSGPSDPSPDHRRAPRLLSSADESFLDNPTPVDAVDMADRSMNAPPRPRDSHDLSLSPRDITRDSLVTNMLMSLDQFSLIQPEGSYESEPTYDDAPQVFDTTRTWASNLPSERAARPQHHHQYSYSSDLDLAEDQSRMSSQTSRGRRSNSSSNIPNSFSRFSSMRESIHRGQSSAPRGGHSHGKGSKSSSSASIDAGYVQGHGGHRAARGGFSRSQSFGQEPQQPSPPQPLQHQQLQQLQQIQQSSPMSPFQIDFPTTYIDDDDDFNAAPMPTIPGGPRRTPSTPVIPKAPPEPVDHHALERKRSTSRSLKSSSGRKVPSTPRQPVPALPALDLESAPAPNIGYEKSKEVPGRPVSGNAPAQAKEKPGFFRRVFGGGSSKTSSPSAATTVDSPKSSHFTASTDNSDRPGSNKMGHQASQSTQRSAPPSRDTASSHSQHPTLQKKPSSFFRRRKKSVAGEQQPPLPVEAAPPVPPIAPINYQPDKDLPEPSPVSSLRKVMTPYLRANANSATPSQMASPLSDITNTVNDRPGASTEREQFKREFSPDYEPSPNARIRPVRSDSDRETSQTVETPTRQPPQRPGMPGERNNSFLDLDGASDNEEELPIQANRKSAGKENRKDPATPSSLAPRDGRDDTLRPKKKGPFSLETDSEDDPARSNLALPIEGARAISPASTGTGYKTAPSAPPSVRIEDSSEPSPKVLGSLKSMKPKSLDEPGFVVGEPTEDDRQKAQKIYDGNEDFIQREKAASWMGEEGPVRQRTLQAYMELYDFSGQSIVYALRQICGRLVFRAETQQVDRILVAFSKRWCTCNPNHGFKITDIIHTICYSIMLLNTDLHMADIEQKMTRGQFVKNTLTTITHTVTESAPDAFERASILPEKSGMLGVDTGRTSGEHDRKSFRNSFKPPSRPDAQGNGSADNAEDCGPLVKAPFNGSKKAWEELVEVVLKSIYTSIRDERLPLFGAEPERHLPPTASQGSLSVMGMLKRSPSVLSKAPSESQMSTRGRIADSTKNGASRWSSKSRSRPGVGRNGFSSSRTSLDDGNSLWSPALSSATWSKYSLGRTQTSMSQDSFGSAMPRGDYQQSIGFANALSQAIIRDEDANGNESAPSMMSVEIPATQLLEDESLELSGPPWVKEGMVIHKHHLDGVEKKAKDRNWAEVFAVIQKGQMSLFSFTSNNKSARQKNRNRSTAKVNTPVGGGNWQDNATNMGTFSLRQTLASALPPPGYSRTRPHVWALSLPTGAVHLFQVGTPEIIKEFVTTVNYWSARLSTHPLVGGISNVEYGWSDSIVNNALVAAINDNAPPGGKTSRPGSAAAGRRSSVQSSIRSASFDQGSGTFTHGRSKLPGDRIHIAKWTPPTQSLRPSNSTEAEQLETLVAYVKGIEQELLVHNQLRSPMLLAFTPRGGNAGKAMANWESKSAYLLREIVKFRTYVDCLQQADTRKREIYTERDLARRAARGELSDGDMEVSGEEGDETLRP